MLLGTILNLKDIKELVIKIKEAGDK